MRNQRGITLIALVITIIVLLILAGVSIAMLSGDNGILTRANQAADETAFATARENVANTINEAMTNYYGNLYVNDVTTSTIDGTIKAALAKYTSGYKDDAGATVKYDESAKTVTITFNGYKDVGNLKKDSSGNLIGGISWTGVQPDSGS